MRPSRRRASQVSQVAPRPCAGCVGICLGRGDGLTDAAVDAGGPRGRCYARSCATDVHAPGRRRPVLAASSLAVDHSYLSGMIDDESRRNDERLARLLRDMKRCCEEIRQTLSRGLGEEVGRHFFDEVVDAIEREPAARKLIRDFFDRRSRTRQSQEPKAGVHASVHVIPMRRGRNATNIGICCASSADSVSPAKTSPRAG